jgi:polyhydroxybutyrate depolymerase
MERSLIRNFVIGVLGLSAVACAPLNMIRGDTQWTPGTTSYDVMVGNEVRNFIVHVPPLPRRNRLGIVRPFPLVVLLHGSGADAETIERQTNFDSLADVAHVVTVYPNGVSMLGFGSDWNSGTCCGVPKQNKVNDVEFIRTVIQNVSAHVPVDRRRIFVAGFSSGGSMAYHVACAMAPTVAAIGVVSASLLDDSCRPSRPVPVIAFHGTADGDVPYLEQSLTPLPHAFPDTLPNIPPSMLFWASENGCSEPVTQQVSLHVSRLSFAKCSGADAVLYTIEGGRHAWPGGEKDGDGGDEPTTEVQASQVLLRFFLRHARTPTSPS